MKKDWLYFRKSDRKVLVLLLSVCLAVVTVLIVFFSQKSDSEKKIELPEHWWEKK